MKKIKISRSRHTKKLLQLTADNGPGVLHAPVEKTGHVLQDDNPWLYLTHSLEHVEEHVRSRVTHAETLAHSGQPLAGEAG